MCEYLNLAWRDTISTISKGIVAILGIFILYYILGNINEFLDVSSPSLVSGPNIATKTAYTQDGQNFVSKERVEENIKYSYAKPGDYKEVQVPLSTVVVGASVIPEGISEEEDKDASSKYTFQNGRKGSEQEYSASDKQWIDNVIETSSAISQEFNILSKAAANYQFDEIETHCSRLMPIAGDALTASKDCEISSQFLESKSLYEISMQEFLDGCNYVLEGINERDVNAMATGKDYIMNGKNHLDKAINLLPQ